jgi:DNA repair protein REV1
MFCQGDILDHSLHNLKTLFGNKTGENLFNFAQGIDTRDIEPKPRKSIGVDCNWGVRLSTMEEVSKFLLQLASELSDRLLQSNASASALSMILRVRHPESPIDPAKFLGMGRTENFTRSITITSPCSDKDSLFRHSKNLFEVHMQALKFQITDVRGLGIHANKLISVPTPKNSINPEPTANFSKKRTNTISQLFQKNPKKLKTEKLIPKDQAPPVKKAKLKRTHTIRESQIDPNVFAQLPSQIQREVMETVERPQKIIGNLLPIPSSSPLVSQLSSTEEYRQFFHWTEEYCMFREWLLSLTAPSSSDIAKIQQTCTHYIRSMNLEDAQNALILIRQYPSI